MLLTRSYQFKYDSLFTNIDVSLFNFISLIFKIIFLNDITFLLFYSNYTNF